MFENSFQNSAKKVTAQPLKIVAAQLAALLHNDAAEATDYLEKHEPLLIAAFPEQFGKLHQAIEDYDFTNALYWLKQAIAPWQPLDLRTLNMNTLNEQRKAIILVIDDTPDNLMLMSSLLKDEYQVKVANNGERGLKIAQGETPPDLILLDIMMPDLDGYQVCEQLKAEPRTRNIPVIFLTAKTETDDERYGFELGAVDYITKPISPPIVLARVKNHLILKAAADFLRDKNDFLEQEIQKRTEEVMAIQDVTIQVVTSLAETRDPETGNHIRRTQLYVKTLAEKLAKHPRFMNFLNEQKIEVIQKSAPLHDIGKVGIPDRILMKPGRFTPEEFEIMKTHTSLGHDAILKAERQLGMKVDFLQTAKEIALSHQEKWDGSGYPEGLMGDAIPVSARIMAVADVYDALISRRVYKDGMPHETALAIMTEGRGTHFDPDILDAFMEIHESVRAIAELYADGDKELAAKREGLKWLDGE